MSTGFNQSVGQNLGQSQRQSQELSAQQLQSLSLLELPIQDLEASIKEELMTNPLLELDNEPLLREKESKEEDASIPDPDRNFDADTYPNETPNTPLDENRTDFDEGMDDILSGDEKWETFSPESSRDAIRDSDERYQFAIDSISSRQSLQDLLVEQLELSDCPEKLIPAAQEIIGNLDDRGYLQASLSEIGEATGISEQDAEQALAVIQKFDPAGIGARDREECLILQLKRRNEWTPKLDTLIRKHLDDLGHNRRPLIAEAMKIPVEEVNALASVIRTLDPHPASAFTPETTICAVPEVTVEKDGEDYVVRANKEYAPSLRIAPKYEKLLEDPGLSKEDRTYIRNKIMGGKQFINALDFRESTIVRVAKCIVALQYDFLEGGNLHPMTQRDIAERIGVHETTVGRAVKNKYIQLPSGLIAFDKLFSTGYQSADGEEVSVRGIKELIRAAVDAEDPEKPLSDSKLEKMLAEKGFQVARRTVAKYREELGILSSQGRKVYK